MKKSTMSKLTIGNPISKEPNKSRHADIRDIYAASAAERLSKVYEESISEQLMRSFINKECKISSE